MTRRQTGDSEVEKEANPFAAELLMPTSFPKSGPRQCGRDGPLDKDVLKGLTGKHHISKQVLTCRLTYLDYVK